MSELLPCPFCGNDDISLNEPSSFWPKGSINCPACMVVMPGEIGGDRQKPELIEQWNARTVDHAQGSQASILLPRKLTAENGAKAALIGEFKETVEIMDEDGEEHWMDVPVSWDTIKRIWDMAVAHFEKTGSQSPAGNVRPWSELEGNTFFPSWRTDPAFAAGCKSRDQEVDALTAEIERLQEHKRKQMEDIMNLGQQVGKLETELAQSVAQVERAEAALVWLENEDPLLGDKMRERMSVTSTVRTAEPPDKLHPSHKTRISDASSFDEICTVCGATDRIGSWGGLRYPCSGASNTPHDRQPGEAE